MNWRDNPMVCFDLESTGVDTETALIVSSCVALIPKDMGDGLGRPPKIFSRISSVEVPEEAAAIHGMTTEYVRQHGAEPTVAIQEAVGLLRLAVERGLPIIGHNLRYDLTLLDRECLRHGIEPIAERPEDLRPCIDTFVVDKAADPFRKKRPDGTSTRVLTGLCDHWGVKLDGAAHDSTVDALASARIAFKMAKGPIPRAASERPYSTPQLDIGAMKLDDLHDAQIEWAAKQAKSMATFFRGLASQQADPAERDALLAKADGCRPEWPFIPRPVAPDNGGQASLWD